MASQEASDTPAYLWGVILRKPRLSRMAAQPLHFEAVPRKKTNQQKCVRPYRPLMGAFYILLARDTLSVVLS